MTQCDRHKNENPPCRAFRRYVVTVGLTAANLAEVQAYATGTHADGCVTPHDEVATAIDRGLRDTFPSCFVEIENAGTLEPLEEPA